MKYVYYTCICKRSSHDTQTTLALLLLGKNAARRVAAAENFFGDSAELTVSLEKFISYDF